MNCKVEGLKSLKNQTDSISHTHTMQSSIWHLTIPPATVKQGVTAPDQSIRTTTEYVLLI